jgi:hypothetical protein
MRRVLFLLFALALAACAGVLGLKPKREVHPFEHRAHVLKGVACTECHAGITAADDEGALHIPSADTCKRCHQKPHDPRDCSQCHGEAHTRTRVALARHHLRFAHRQHAAASGGQCVRCHVKIGEPTVETMLPPMAACFGCHKHKDQFAMRECDGCHVDLPAERVTPSDHLVHDGDFLRRHGVQAASSRDLCSTCHTETSCAKCHGTTVPALPARMAFDDVRLGGLHRGNFRSRHAEESRNQPGLCITCHSESSCRECHERQRVGSGSGRSPHPRGWLLAGRGGGDHGQAARLDPASCASCHGGAGEQLCIGCHRVGGPGGNPHGPGFNSNKDKMRDVPCRQCHAP